MSDAPADGPGARTPLPSAPPEVAGERAMLDGFLDHYRAVVIRKLEGLDEPAARLARTTSGMSVLGAVSHLANVELWWFVEVFAATELDYPWPGADATADPDWDWKPPASLSVPDVLGLYRRACDQARRAAAGRSLDDVVTMPGGDPRSARSLRWIYLHLIEETARHAGHLDLMREAADGTTGD